ncbi:hypothetical protein BN973_03554 [Mycobacterium rhizamassiliense]|jgi:hypothetical protein|uniref:Uncharacterized protein n=1 Tax=Mycobacterium rhizamassiliense TaxID=1841860 RepID=A0A2U3NXY9_9MYCO|nr:hypothetical protein [Mycobacterium rhizamassiliense]SPM36387.1 hypothetical protein BN973_03554 [Mycobacterium rhizamassiliense]
MTSQLQILLDELAQLTKQPPPPGITPDQLATGQSLMSQLLRIFGLAANTGDPADMTAAEGGYAQRDAKTGDALTKFPANEAESAQKAAQPDQMAQMVQQIPQMLSGMLGGLSGAMSGLMQPLSQLPQQAMQAMQAGMGAMQHGAGGAAAGAIPAELAGSTKGAGGLGGGGGGLGGGLGATTPTAMLGPLPAPSAGTEPAAAHGAAGGTPSAATPSAGPRGGMGGMPMMPPGGMHGGAGSNKDDKPGTKRIVAPTVKNGAPVQGRITKPPPSPEVVKRVEGKPIASRRILLPEQKRDDDEPDSTR